MKNHILTLSIFLLITPLIYAVGDRSNIITIKGGLSVSTLNREDFTNRTGFNLGATIDFEVAPMMFVGTGLEVVSKGGKSKSDGFAGKINATYLQLPAYFAIGMPIMPGVGGYLQLGSYVAYGIGGKTEYTQEDVLHKVNTFSKTGLKKFDCGVGLGFGLMVMNVRITTGYNFGFLNVAQQGAKTRNGNFYLSGGFMF